MTPDQLENGRKKRAKDAKKAHELAVQITSLSEKLTAMNLSIVNFLSTLEQSNNVRAVRYCEDCKSFSSTLECGGKCLRTNAPTEREDYCSRSTPKAETLCWRCKNAVGGCSWSRSFEPVNGWDAIPNVAGHSDSYIVYDCPEFVED